MKTETVNKIKHIFDRVYDIITVQLIGAVIFILIALTVKFIGGNLYTDTRTIYYSAIDSEVNAQIVTDDKNLIDDTSSNTGDATSKIPEEYSTKKEQTESMIENSETIQTNAGYNNYIWPLNGKITANYGDISNMFSGPDSSHTGIDISAVTGTPIKAVESGIITYSGYSDGFGYHIIVNHSNNISSIYAHCSQLLYKKGTNVNKGDVIALVGSSGKATGAHLHLEFTNNGISVDPLWLLPPINNI